MNLHTLFRTINSIHLDQIDLTDPTQWIQWTISLSSKTIRYLYHNITLPRVSPEYEHHKVSILPELPSRQDIVVGIWEILSSVHPNYYAIALMFVCVGIFVYIKIRYPFWNTQPVVHTYDWYRRWIQSTPGILQKYPFKTRFYDTTKQIQTIDFSHIPKPIHDESKQLKQICEFIQSNYIPSDRLLSTITEKVLSLYLSGQNAPSYISLSFEDKSSPVNPSSPSFVPHSGLVAIHRELDQTITGVCTSRLLNLYMYEVEPMSAGGSLETPPLIHLKTYYLDYMTVRRETETRVAERLFHTHEYNIRIANPTIAVSMFQKDGEPCEGVVPFFQYNTQTFYMRNIQVDPLPPDFIISRVAKENVDMLHDIYHILTTPETGTKKMWSMCLLPDIGHVRELLVNRQMYLFCLKKGGHLYGAYFFKDMNIHYEDLDGKTLGLVASIQNTDSLPLFMSGFMMSLREILKETAQYKMLMIRDIGHNEFILGKWREYHHTILDTPNGVYLYNYCLPNMPVLRSDLFSLV